MKKSITIIIFIIIINLIIPAVLASDSTPSADIKSKLEELKREIASKAARLKQEVDRKLKDKAYVGKVKSKSDFSLTIATDSGPKIVSINQDTILPKKTISLEDYVASLGDSDETGVLTAKKVIILPKPKNEKPKAFLWGQVISLSDQLITLKTTGFRNVSVSLPNSLSVKLNDFVILTGNFNNNEIFEARFVYVVPQGGIIKPKKSATPKPTSR